MTFQLKNSGKFKSMKNTSLLASFLIGTALTLGVSAGAQNQDVSVVNLKVVRNMAGGQSVITPKGDLAPLPGGGVDGDVAQIYFGSQGGFWYVDRTGNSVDLVPTVKELQARRAQQIPQYAPIAASAPYANNAPLPPASNYNQAQNYNQGQNSNQNYDQNQNYSQNQNSSQNQSSNQSQSSGSGRSGIGSAVTTAAAAMGGAALGSAMTNGYYNVPYGTPMYYRNGNPYYYRDGDHREIEDLNQNQKQMLVNKRIVNNQQQEQLVQQRQANKTERDTNQQARQDQWQQSGNNHQENFNKQQQWYQDQMKQNPGRFEQRGEERGENPFAARGDREGMAQRGEDRGGRAGREGRESGSFAGRGGDRGALKGRSGGRGGFEGRGGGAGRSGGGRRGR